MDAPVVEHPRDVSHAASLLKHAQRQVVVLGAAHLIGREARGLKRRAPHHEEVGDAVMAVEQIEVETRLEHRLDEAARLLEEVLIAEQQVNARLRVEGLRIAVERIGL